MAENTITLPNGRTVTYDKEVRKSQVYNINDLYSYRLVDDGSDIVVNSAETGKYLAQENDFVIAFDLGMFRVSRTDYTSYYNELKLWELPKSASEVGVDDVLLGVGPGYSSETYRVYIDTRVFPHRLDIDSRLKCYGSQGKEVRVFKGIDITASGEVISAYYNQTGDYVSDAIPLQVVTTETENTKAEKAPVMGYTSKTLEDGDLVTVVTYNTAGAVTSIAKMLVHNTNVVRHPEESAKRVKSIELISPWLSATEPNVLEVPINYTTASLAMRGKVTYIDGTSITLDVVDERANGKLQLLGLLYWSPTITGQEQELTLTYELSESEEYAYLQGETANGRVTTAYKIRAIPVDYAYSLKLFAYPTWTGSQSGYSLEFWLYDLTRQIGRKVPKGAISLQDGSVSFDGLEYTSTQYLNVSCDLSVMDANYGDHVHVQTVQVSLLRDGSVAASNWKVKFANNQKGFYGDNLKAVVKADSSGLSTINVGNGLADKAEFLTTLFYGISPLYDPQTETQAPEPTHFTLVTKNRSYEVPIGQWNNDITFQNDLSEGETVYLKWIKRTASTDLALGVSGLPIHQS